MQTNAKPLRSEYENRVHAAREAERSALEAAAAAGQAPAAQGEDTASARGAGAESQRQHTDDSHSSTQILSGLPPFHHGGHVAAGSEHRAAALPDDLPGVQGATPRERRAAYRRQLEERHRGGKQGV